MRYLLTILFLLAPSIATAAYPYDAVCEIDVRRPGSRRSTGESGTIIAVSKTHALVLTCKHVVRSPGRRVKAYWPNVDGGFTSYGRSIDVGRTQDIAAFICPRPPGVRPVYVRLPRRDSGPFTNVGFPGAAHSLQWQQGEYKGLSSSEFYFDGASPVPGMSGGATFDRYGNLVGVIIRYGRTSGVSASGREMIQFVDKFRKKGGWQVGQPRLNYKDRWQ